MPLMACSRAAVNAAGTIASEGHRSNDRKGDQGGGKRQAYQRHHQEIYR